MTVTAYSFPRVYERLGMAGAPRKLGCIMLDLEPIPVTSMLPADTTYFYGDDDQNLWYARGPVAEKGAHATLLYGLTPDEHAGVRERESVDELLAGLDLSSVTIADIGHFPGQFGLPYACIIAHVTSPDLIEANRRLRFLPHVDTFLEYRPHVTLAYVHEGDRETTIPALQSLVGATLPATGINYGEPST
ncbi:2'-5' RNA ligase family protein [Leifsonia aquatica]|uniref:2'-5' RNA ligase family protein n=1 Tax=Leifsonia aquatica TaxID=144185 RepID=UPI0037FBCF3F